MGRTSVRSLRRAAGLLIVAPWVADVAAAQGYTLLQIDGAAPFDLAGLSVAAAGDYNFDGRQDFLVAVPGADPGGLLDAGAVRIHSGVDGTILQSFAGAAAGDTYGYSVASVGDLNADGQPEFMIGAPQDGTAGTGYAEVRAGGTGTLLYSYTGLAAGDRFGACVASAGRVTIFDAVNELFVGAPRQGSGVGPGYARVYNGIGGGLIHTLNGTAIGDSFGAALSGVGSVNGDLYGDLIVGAPTDSAGGTNAGSVRIYSGFNLQVLVSIPSTPNLFFGSAVLGLGDVNLDAVADYATTALWPDNQTGYVSIVAGGSNQGMFTLGGTSLDWFGYSIAQAGADLNADAFNKDFIVGAPGSALGFEPGYARVYAQTPINVKALVTIPGAAFGDAFGWSVSATGDVDDDGVVDFVVGAPGADPGGNLAAGSARVVSIAGLPTGSSRYGAGCPGPGGQVPRIAVLGAEPKLGPVPTPPTGSTGILVTKVPPAKTALLLMGFSNSAWGAAPLPLNLAFLGLPACSLEVAPFSTTTTITNGSAPLSGAAAVVLTLPNQPTLAGLHVYFQWFVADPGPSLLPGSMSEGLDVVLL